MSRSKIAKEIRKVEQSTGGKEGRVEKVGENYLEKTMNHFVLPFLYEAMLVKRQDSHLLSFRRGMGRKNMAEPECLMESMIDNVGGSLKRNLVPSFAILISDCLLESFQIVFLVFGGDEIDDQ